MKQQSHADSLAIQQRSFEENTDSIRVTIVSGEMPQFNVQNSVSPQVQEVRIERVEVPVIVEKEVKEIVYVDRPFIVEKIVTERIEVPVVVRETIIERIEIPVTKIVPTQSGAVTIVEKDLPKSIKLCLAVQSVIATILLLKMILNK